MKFLGTPLEIPNAVSGTQAVRRQMVDQLAVRVTDLENDGGGGLATTTAADDFTASVGQFVLVDASAAPLTVTLPSAPAVDSVVAVKKVDITYNIVTVVGSDGDTIDGDPAVYLPAAQVAATFVYDGANWQVSSVVVYDTGTIPMFTYRGDYDADTGYLLNDVVSFQGNSYVARQATTGTEPSLDATDATWGLMALHGAKGDTGDPGAAGADGTGGGGGGLARTVAATAALTAASGDLVLADATTGAFTVTLPSGLAVGAQIAVRKTDASVNNVTVVGTGATIEGDPSAIITGQNLGAWFIFDGTNWLILQYLGV